MRTRAAAKVIEYQGLTVHVDRPQGTTISGTGPEGESYSFTQQDDYGFLRHADGTRILGDDGEDYDAYLGPSPLAASVHVVTQLRAKDGAYDEQKAMLGYDSREEAEATYRAHTHPAMFGDCLSLPVESFKAQLEAHRMSGTKAPFRATPAASSASEKTTADGNTIAPVQPPHSETKDMSDAALRAKDAGGAGAPAADTGSAVPRPSGLCVRAAKLSAVREDVREVDFICSTDAVDSYGEVVRQTWDLKRFAGNPVALWSHQSHELPIGRWKDVRVEDGALKGTLVVASAAANPKAENVWQSIREKTLCAVSVGFLPHKVSFEEIDGKDEVCVLDENELYEISVTPIPANPEALVDLKARAIEVFRARAAVPYQAFPPKDTGSWDASAAVKRIRKWASSDGSGSPDHIDWTKYRLAFAWMDPQQTHAFGGFKLPHHDVVDGKLVTSRAGVIAAGNAIAGSRGGVKIPDADVAGVKSHLEKHYHQFDLKAPWEDDGKAAGSTASSAAPEGTGTNPKGPARAAKKERHVAKDMDEEAQKKAAKGMITCPKCGEDFDPDDDGDDDDDEDEKAKKAFTHRNVKHFVRHQTQKLAAERDAATAKVAGLETKNADLEKRLAEQGKKLTEAELAPLVGVKFAPAQLQGHVDLAAFYQTQPDGAERWQKHLEGLKAAPDMKLLGGSAIGKDPTASGLHTNAAGGEDDLTSLVNAEARQG